MKLNWRRMPLRLRHFFATSRGGIAEKQTIVVELEHAGVIGLGEIVASDLYGQSLEACEAALPRVAALLGDEPFAVEPIISRLIDRLDGLRCLICGIDSALHDWIGKKIGLPVWRLLGLPRPRVRTTFTIGVATPDEVRIKLREALAAGFDALKVKVGSPQDERTLELVRESFSGELLLDANEAWTPDNAMSRIRALLAFRPTVIEQPLRRADWRQMAGLRGCGAAIIADESCERPADVARLAGVVDGVNIKFTKCGGIREAQRMIALARGLGMRVMLGCFISSSLAIAPALAIAGLVDYADLDGHLLLADDPFSGLTSEGSLLIASGAAGLGVAPKSEPPAPARPHSTNEPGL
ncbi:MAG: dipeptide epimerase [Phycisphaerae bacterium]